MKRRPDHPTSSCWDGGGPQPGRTEERALLDVSEVRVRLVDEPTDDLVGWASCVVNGVLYLNNMAIRRGENGRLALHFPATRSRGEHRYFHFNPITPEAKAVLDDAILGKLCHTGVTT